MNIILLLIGFAGVLVAVLGVRSSRKQRRVDTGNLYLQRYWKIDDALLISPKGSPEHLRHQHRYLRLSDDEFDAAEQQWIDQSQWIIWHSWLATDQTRRQLTADLSAIGATELDFQNLRLCVEKSGVGHPWASCAAHRRRGRYYLWT